MNSATEALRLVLLNHEPSYNLAKMLAHTAWVEAPQHENVPKIWNREQTARFTLADELKAMVEREMDEIDDSRTLKGIWNSNPILSSLLRAAFDDVDWNEIADDFLEDYLPRETSPAANPVE